MRIVVIGPGAIGCLFAGLLSESGEDVTLLDRDAGRAKRIALQGLRITDERGTRTIGVTASAALGGIPPPDFVCVCVKSYDTASAAASLAPLLGPGTHVVSLQNGLRNAGVLAAHSDADRVLVAATAHGATTLGTGHVRHAGRGMTSVAAYGSAGAAAARFASTLSQAGMPAEVQPDSRAVLWSKLAVNAAINAVTALWDVPNGARVEREDLNRIMTAAAGEAERVARAAEVELLYPDASQRATEVCRGTAANVSSMLQDLRSGRRTEVDAINGAVVEEGTRRGLPVSVNRVLLRRVLARSQSATG